MTDDPIPHQEVFNKLHGMYAEEWAMFYGVPVERVEDECYTNDDGHQTYRKRFVVGDNHQKSKPLGLFVAADRLMEVAGYHAV